MTAAQFEPAEPAPRLRIAGLTKRFGTLTANDGVSFDVTGGELHCLVGENGAGKSTLTGCIAGLLVPDEGQIFYEGQPVRIDSPIAASRLGIAVVRQHFTLIGRFTITENVTLGTRVTSSRLEARARLDALTAALGIEIDPDARVEALPVGQQQWVEILKALYLDCRLLLLDEPTAVLTPQESQHLFAMIAGMTARGIAVVLISHKFDEVMRADRVTVLRRGRVVATVRRGAATREQLAEMMVGRGVSFGAVRLATQSPGATLLEVRDLVLPGRNATPMSFQIRAGEILGLAAVAGNGQDALFETLAGGARAVAGEVRLNGERIDGLPPPAIAGRGIGYVPSDRYRDGLIPTFSIADNLILGRQHAPSVAPYGFLDRKTISREARASIKTYGITPDAIDTPVTELSGGNAQKVILAREFQAARRCLLCHQPTRGLDIGVIQSIRHQLLILRATGAGILLASEDLDELMALSDRIMVMFRGRIMGIVDAATTSRDAIGLMMAGERLA